MQVKGDLQDLIAKLLSFVQPLVFVPDEYFTGKTYTYRKELPVWDYTKPAEKLDFDLAEDTSKEHAALRILAFLAFEREGSGELPDIRDYTGIPESSLWRYLNRFKE
ncbi:hypothetical protein, partial [Methanosarcina sp. 2.H.T.1A.3]|uniref:hypothetical protein n=1 Tax=Methanosarcina sp. 2.H.T.1A.3 TaxID=1483597 RepID=UPI001391A01C